MLQLKNPVAVVIGMHMTGKHIQWLILFQLWQLSPVIVKQQITAIQLHQKTAVCNIGYVHQPIPSFHKAIIMHNVQLCKWETQRIQLVNGNCIHYNNGKERI